MTELVTAPEETTADTPDTPPVSDTEDSTTVDPDTEVPDKQESETPADTDEPVGGGCAFTISVTAVLALSIASAAVCVKKKERE